MYKFQFTDVGEGIHEGTIIKWLFQVGDKIQEGDVLAKVETDKLVFDLPSPVAGTIIKIYYAENDIIFVGKTIVLIQELSDTEEDVKRALLDEIITPQQSQQSDTSTSLSYDTPTIPQKVLATPLVRRLAKDLGIELSTIKGTGLGGKILKVDVQNAQLLQTSPVVSHNEPQTSILNAKEATVSATQGIEIIKISRLRKAIAQKMTLSKSKIPEATLIDEVNISALVSLRKQAKVHAESQGIKLTFLAFIMKAVSIALQQFPIFNSSYDEQKEEIILKKFINLGIAVDTKEGLVVPNIKNVAKLNLLELAQQLQQAAKAAIERNLQLDQLQNGTFTITNFGSLDISYGTPVINYPELAILGVGKISQKPIVENNQIIIADILPLSLAFDHRIIDGADGGRFLKRIKELLNAPILLLLS